MAFLFAETKGFEHYTFSTPFAATAQGLRILSSYFTKPTTRVGLIKQVRAPTDEVRTSHTPSYTKPVIDARAGDIVAVMKPLAPEAMSDEDLEVRATELIHLYDIVRSHMKEVKGKGKKWK